MATQTQTTDPGRMYSWDALRVCIGPFSAFVARRLGMSRSTIEKWQRQPGPWPANGIRNPALRLDETIDEVIAQGQDPHRALMPVAHLANKRGYGLYSLDGTQLEPVSPLGMLANWTQRAGTLAALFAIAWEDGKVDAGERRMIKEQIEEARHQLCQIEAGLDVRAA